jgi:hypothetical protein
MKHSCYQLLIYETFMLSITNLWNIHAGTSKTGFRQVKIIEFVWINIIFFLNLAFGQASEKIKAKTDVY